MKPFQTKLYHKKLIKNILDNIEEDDYFYNKKYNWEEWVIMRVDIREAIKKIDYKCMSDYSPDILYKLLEFLEGK